MAADIRQFEMCLSVRPEQLLSASFACLWHGFGGQEVREFLLSGQRPAISGHDMKPGKPPAGQDDLLRGGLAGMIDMRHGLVKLAVLIDR
ncbi:MAG: hypothetical protein Q4P24_09540, partial [Rhodobacterales bacterium]|nr:hypothetical protein [Rhodobacterales bacterium]